jgi:hypothetical protein
MTGEKWILEHVFLFRYCTQRRMTGEKWILEHVFLFKYCHTEMDDWREMDTGTCISV